MSAIWGIVSLSGSEANAGRFHEVCMTSYKAKYRIDRYAQADLGSAHFGCGIQHITAESVNERLPVVDVEKGILFTADAVLDNRRDIIALLSKKGEDAALLADTPDGLLIFKTFLYFGTSCVKYLRGLFSFAIWLELEKKLLLFSDPVSSRCLYYTRQGDSIMFSTVIAPIEAVFSDIPFNENYIKDFLLSDRATVCCVPGETLRDGVFLLTPATVMTFSESGVETKTYMSSETLDIPALDQIYTKNLSSPEDYLNSFMHLYEDCIKDAIRTSGNVGIAMSSGLDSSSIGTVAAKQLEECGKKLFTYTFLPCRDMSGKNTETRVFDEAEAVKEITARYPAMCPSFLRESNEDPILTQPAYEAVLEMPYKIMSYKNHFDMCKAAVDAGCKVFLNGGLGNLTVSFGSLEHIVYQLMVDGDTDSAARYVANYARHEGLDAGRFYASLMYDIHSFKKPGPVTANGFIPDNSFVSPSVLENYRFEDRMNADSRKQAVSGFMSHKDYLTALFSPLLFMQAGVFETKLGLYHNVIVRDPTKDARMLKFCTQVPYHLFCNEGEPRWFVRHGFKNLLPNAVTAHWRAQSYLNADWTELTAENWENTKPVLKKVFLNHTMNKYLNIPLISSYMENADLGNSDARSLLSHIRTMYGILKFTEV